MLLGVALSMYIISLEQYNTIHPIQLHHRYHLYTCIWKHTLIKISAVFFCRWQQTNIICTTSNHMDLTSSNLSINSLKLPGLLHKAILLPKTYPILFVRYCFRLNNIKSIWILRIPITSWNHSMTTATVDLDK